MKTFNLLLIFDTIVMLLVSGQDLTANCATNEERINSTDNNIINMFDSLKQFITATVKDSESRTNAFFNSKFESLLDSIHDEKRNKIDALGSISTIGNICDQNITAHFVLYKNKMMGFSVAHSPCYYNQLLPTYLETCPLLDISVWLDQPPIHVSLLNITDNVVGAKLGDSATAFGFHFGRHRAWHGTISGRLGYNTTSTSHFTSVAFENENELLFQGSQGPGMSGGAVVNGRGYLGVVRAVSTDSVGNKSPTVVPFNLFQQCVEDLMVRFPRRFYDYDPAFRVLDVPKLAV